MVDFLLELLVFRDFLDCWERGSGCWVVGVGVMRGLCLVLLRMEQKQLSG